MLAPLELCQCHYGWLLLCYHLKNEIKKRLQHAKCDTIYLDHVMRWKLVSIFSLFAFEMSWIVFVGGFFWIGLALMGFSIRFLIYMKNIKKMCRLKNLNENEKCKILSRIYKIITELIFLLLGSSLDCKTDGKFIVSKRI